MTAQNAGQPPARRNVFEATLARIVGAGRSRCDASTSRLRKMSLLRGFANRKPIQDPDPVLVAVFAIDRVGPAAVRACASGVEVRIAATDEATAAVIRAALSETARRRPTDRLIQVVID